MSTSSEQFPAQSAPQPWPLAPEPEPVFGLGTVAVTFISTLVAIVLCGAFAIVIARHLPAFRHVNPAELATNPRLIVPAQLAAYLAVFAALWRYFSHLQIGFSRAISWQWPTRWPAFIGAGALLALVVLLSARLLPTPPELPIDKMLRTPFDAWLLSIFGVLIAPFVEELLFRGLLFPALARRAGAIFSLIVTSVFFGTIHAQQLAGAWVQVTCIIVVGAVLTMTRWRYRSLACSTLVHIGYNGALFAALFLHTHGFTNFNVH